MTKQRFDPILWAACLLLLCTAGAAQAQSTYKCRKPGGAVYYADKPCPEEAATVIAGDKLPLASMPTASDYRLYLRSECRELLDRIDYVDGYDPDLSRTEMRERSRERSRLRQIYRTECGEEEQLARELVNSKMPLSARDARIEQLIQRLEARARANVVAEQCKTMRQLRNDKETRVDSMTRGERAEFERFLENFAARCQGLVVVP